MGSVTVPELEYRSNRVRVHVITTLRLYSDYYTPVPRHPHAHGSHDRYNRDRSPL